METVPFAVWAGARTAWRADPRQPPRGRDAAAGVRRQSFALGAGRRSGRRHFRVLRDGRELEPHELPLQRATRGEIVRNDELRIVFDDGTFYDELISATPIRDAGGTVIVGAVGAAVDITERKAAEEQMRHMALHDPLTGLPNRTLFQDRLGQALARARRQGGQVAVMLLDLDHFKDVNDSARACRRRCAAARGRGSRLRHGRAGQRHLGPAGRRRVRAGPGGAARRTTPRSWPRGSWPRWTRPFRLDGHERRRRPAASASRSFPADGDTPERLVRNADVALYRAKAAGRGRFESYSRELDRELQPRSDAAARPAARRSSRTGCELVYQPLFELPRQRLVKVEALVRWPHPDGGLVPPATFIPIAESSGLIHAAGRVGPGAGLPAGCGLARRRAARSRSR